MAALLASQWWSGGSRTGGRKRLGGLKRGLNTTLKVEEKWTRRMKAKDAVLHDFDEGK